MSCSVQVLCPNGRRVNVKIGANAPLLNILEQVCTKQPEFDPKCHVLKKGKTQLDLSLTFRFSGLPNNTKLELVRTDQSRSPVVPVVELVVQDEDSQRYQETFPSSANLWSILNYHKLISSMRDKTTPTVVYMRQQINGEDQLRKTTLKDLGLLGGRGALRFIWRSINERVEPAGSNEGVFNNKEMEYTNKEMESSNNEEIESINKEVVNKEMESSNNEGVESINKEVGNKEMESSNNEGVEPEVVEMMEYNISEDDPPLYPAHPISIFPPDINTDNNEMDLPTEDLPIEEFPAIDHSPNVDEGVASNVNMIVLPQEMMKPVAVVQKIYDVACERNTVIYHLDAVPTTPTSDDLDDKFFQVTIEDVLVMQDDLKKQIQRETDAPLMTQSMRANKGRHIYNQTVIRVILPDRWVIQGTFNANESLKSLVKFIRENMEHPQMKFHLYTTPPKEVLRDGRMTFNDAGLVPAANVHFSWNEPNTADTCNILSERSLSLYCDTVIQAEILATQSRPQLKTVRSLEEQPSTSQSTKRKDNTNKESTTSGSGQKLPKWLKLGHK